MRTFLSRFSPAAAAVFLLGLALRLYRLNWESVSHDEAFSMAATRLPVGGMIEELVADFVHPPLHYFVLRGWLDLTGYGVLQARLLSVIFGTLAIVVLYRLAKYLFDERTALFSCLLLATSQLSIMQAQDGRMYGLVLFLVLSCSYLFVRALDERSFALWCGFTLLAIVLIYTHYFGFLVLGTFVAYGLLFWRRLAIPLNWWLGSAAIVVLCYVPWLTSGIVEAAANSGKTFSGRNEWWAVDKTTFFAAFNFFSNGKPAGLLNSSPIWTLPAAGLLFGLPLAIGFFSNRESQDRRNFWLLAMLAALPVLGAVVAGLMKLQYDHRYVAFCAAPYYILVGRGFASIRQDAARIGLIVLLLAYSANSLRANYFMPKREDYRSAAAWVEGHRQPGDCGVFLPRYRVPSQWGIEHPDVEPFRILSAEDFAERAGTCDRIWTVSSALSGNTVQKARAKAEQQRIAGSHTLVDEQHYTWVDVALFTRK